MFLALAYVCAGSTCNPIVSPYLYDTVMQCEAANFDAKKSMEDNQLEVLQRWCLALGEEA